jgi:Protein of unknown function (DUF2934)
MAAPAIARTSSQEENVQMKSPSQQDIANLAYALWQQRGSPDGSGGQDWLEAEQQLIGGPEKSLSAS